ncbi:MAG: hypothetical protein IAF02_24330, partial [Anaerolineae bacterium]|nr:hypothetical protein [Anaerolineae bacterium]
TPIVIDEGKGNVGTFSSMAVVDGHPAIAYIDFTKDALMYIRATNSEGTSWGNPVLIDAEGIADNVFGHGQFTSLTVIDGYPAIAYMATNAYVATDKMHLRYVRANDATGQSWGNPMILDTNNGGQYPTLLVVNGNPAISYSSLDSAAPELRFIRANDANGISWKTPVTILDDFAYYISMAIINGNPAISYYDGSTAQGGNDDLRYVRATDMDGGSWGISIIVDSAGNVGKSSALAEVSGHPAIAYFDDTNDDLLYIRAEDANGETWNTSIFVADAGSGEPNLLSATGIFISLDIVNNNPAVSYYELADRDLKYVRALDNAGTNWGNPLVLDDGIDSGRYTTLVIVDGNPAISYLDADNADVKFIRATDVNGNAWGSDTLVDEGEGEGGTYTSLAMINGRPAISYHDPAVGRRELRYVRANDSLGTSWGIPVVVDESSTDIGRYTTLMAVNGNPAISYYDYTSRDLKYVRALNEDGTNWDSPITLDSLGDVGQYASLSIVNGNPAIAYMEKPRIGSNLKFIRALDENGTTWGSPQLVASGSGNDISLAIINGNPAIVSRSSQGLQYIRADDAIGNSWGTPINWNLSAQYNSLIEVNGRPAISFFASNNRDLMYVRANDANGSSWGTPIVLDSDGSVGWFTSMAVINNHPAISYYDWTNQSLKYISAADEDGDVWNSAITLDDKGEYVGQYTSLMQIGSGVGVSYFGSLRYMYNDNPTAVELMDFDAQSNSDQFFVVGGLLLWTIVFACLRKLIYKRNRRVNVG